MQCSHLTCFCIVLTDENAEVGPVSRPAHFNAPAMVLSPSLETRGQDYVGRRSRPGETSKFITTH